MRKVLGVLVLAALACAEETLTVATFNCEFLTRPKVHMKFGEPFNLRRPKRQQWDAPGFRDKKFAEAARAVAKFIARIGADVVVLQEVGDEKDTRELRNEIKALGLDYPHVAVSAFKDEDTFQHTAVLSKFAFTRVAGTIGGRALYKVEEDDHEQERETGVGKGLLVEFDAHGKAFALFGLHLKSERGGYEADRQRVAQASIVRRHVIKALATQRLVIVAGDLNDHPGQPAVRRLRGFDDIFEELIQTQHAFYWPDARLDQRYTYVYKGRRELIDHILISTALRDACLPNPVPKRGDKRRGPEMGILADSFDPPSGLVSDHRPLVLRLRLK